MKSDSSGLNQPISLRWAKLIFGIAILIVAVLIGMGIAGVHWPKWLLALTAVL